MGVVAGEPVPDYVEDWYWKVLLYIIIVFQMPFSVLVTLLVLLHHIFVLNNITTLEIYKGTKVPWVPGICFNEDGVSQYDGGMIANYLQVYGKDFGWWLFPTVPDNLECEFDFPKAPDLTLLELEQYSHLIVQTLTEPQATPPPPPKVSMLKRPFPEKSTKDK